MRKRFRCKWYLFSGAENHQGYMLRLSSSIDITYKLRCCFAFSFVPIRHRLSSVSRNQQVIGCPSKLLRQIGWTTNDLLVAWDGWRMVTNKKVKQHLNYWVWRWRVEFCCEIWTRARVVSHSVWRKGRFLYNLVSTNNVTPVHWGIRAESRILCS